MRPRLNFRRIACLLWGASVLWLGGCSDKSENIPTSYNSINDLMTLGWDQYNAENFAEARARFREANQRNALYLPAYNGLGWSAVRLADFADAEIQFSFITTLADPVAEKELLADAYAGLCLSAAIQRSVLEISGEGGAEQLQALASQSIQRSQMVFQLMGETYAPTEHDVGFGSHNLHLLNAQNYFYLREFESSEAELGFVDPGFVPQQLQIYGTTVSEEPMNLERVVEDQDTSSYLIPVHTGIHHIISIVPPELVNPLNYITYDVQYDQNRILLTPNPPEFEPIPYDWVEINPNRPDALPGQDSGLNGDNQMSAPINIGFAFPYYGNSYVQILICSNGFVSFTDTDSSGTNQQIPNTSRPNNFIAPYWDDLNLNPVTGHGKCYYYYDAAGNRFIVEWDSVAHADPEAVGAYFTFEMILHPNEDIDFHYKAVVPGALPLFPSATVGKENGNGTSGVKVTVNGSGPLEPASGTGLRMYRPLSFTVSYVYIVNFSEYLYNLIEHIEELI